MENTITNDDVFNKLIGFEYDGKIINEYDGSELYIESEDFWLKFLGKIYFKLVINYFGKWIVIENNNNYDIKQQVLITTKSLIPIDEYVFWNFIDLFIEKDYEKMFDKAESLELLS